MIVSWRHDHKRGSASGSSLDTSAATFMIGLKRGEVGGEGQGVVEIRSTSSARRWIAMSRTRDQMVQAARSGKQNIVEGSAAAGISSKTELKLTGVARASLEELLADYRDFFRQRGLPQWTKDDPRAQEVRRKAYEDNRSYVCYRSYFEEANPERAANAALCLVCQATYLLDRLLKQLERNFIAEGGLSERMTRARLQYRKENPDDQFQQPEPP